MIQLQANFFLTYPNSRNIGVVNTLKPCVTYTFPKEFNIFLGTKPAINLKEIHLRNIYCNEHLIKVKILFNQRMY